MTAATLEQLGAEAASCAACVLSKTRTTVVVGSGRRDAPLFVVGEAPGAAEDAAGQPFIGRSGTLLLELVEEVLGLTRSDCYIANVVKCRPPNNRPPSTAEIASCAHYLDDQLALVHSAVVVTVGNTATRAVLDTKAGITSLRGSVHSSPRCTMPVVPTYHPAAALRGGPSVVAAMRADLALARPFLDGARAR